MKLLFFLIFFSLATESKQLKSSQTIPKSLEQTSSKVEEQLRKAEMWSPKQAA